MATNKAFPGTAESFEALGDSTRRLVFELVCAGPRSVGELAEAVPVSRPAVSQHLRVLKDAGLVIDQAAGTRRIYRVAATGVEQLRAYVEGLWDTALAGFASVVEEEARSMSTTAIKPVEKTLVVDAPVGLAFAVFTERMGDWWPLATHSIGNERTRSARVEGEVGGRIYEIQDDGTEAEWGIVSAWEPPHHFAMEWKVNPDAAAPTLIEVAFSEAEGGGTRVHLLHSRWEQLGPDGAETRDGYDSGWDVVLSGYAQAASEAGD